MDYFCYFSMTEDYPESVKEMSRLLQQASSTPPETPEDTPPKDHLSEGGQPPGENKMGGSTKVAGGGTVPAEGGAKGDEDPNDSGPVSLSQILDRSVYSVSGSTSGSSPMPSSVMGNGTSGHPGNHRGHNKHNITEVASRTITYPDDYEYLKKLVPDLKSEIRNRDQKCDQLISETLELRRQLKKKNEELNKAQREVHKLKVRFTSFIINSGKLR